MTIVFKNRRLEKEVATCLKIKRLVDKYDTIKKCDKTKVDEIIFRANLYHLNSFLRPVVGCNFKKVGLNVVSDIQYYDDQCNPVVVDHDYVIDEEIFSKSDNNALLIAVHETIRGVPYPHWFYELSNTADVTYELMLDKKEALNDLAFIAAHSLG